MTQLEPFVSNEWGIKVKTKEGYGIIHPENGVIIPPSYTFLQPIGDLVRAEKYFREALIINPFKAGSRIGLGKALIDQGRIKEGIVEYKKNKT